MAPLNEALFDAVLGNLIALKALQAEGVDITAPYDELGNTPLMIAARTDHDDFLELVLEAGADVDARNANNETALMWAARCIQPNSLETLLNLGADVNFQDSFGITALYQTILRNNVGMVRFLLDFGAELNVKNCNGLAPLSPVSLKHPFDTNGFIFDVLEIAELHLRAGADVHSLRSNEKTPLLQSLPCLGEPQSSLPRHESGREMAKQLLVVAEAEVTAVWWGVTPLILAAQGFPESLQPLIDAGAELNAMGAVGIGYLCGSREDNTLPISPANSNQGSVLAIETQCNSREQAQRESTEATVEFYVVTALDIARTRGDEQSVQILLRGLHRHIAAALSVMPEEVADVGVRRKILELWLGVPLEYNNTTA